MLPAVMIMDKASETVSNCMLPFIRVPLAVVSLQSNRSVTKTTRDWKILSPKGNIYTEAPYFKACGPLWGQKECMSQRWRQTLREECVLDTERQASYTKEFTVFVIAGTERIENNTA